jgi:archaellum component FlaG (FlaF/FlaG flagellin family)
MDRVIVTGLLIIAGVITAVILLGVLSTSVGDTAQTIKTTGKQADAQTKSGITILQVLAHGNGTQLDIWVKNTGSIQIQPLEKVDVFLMDIEGSWGDYITYLPGVPIGGENTWRVLSQVGLKWNPGDTFQLRASLPANPILNNTGYNLSITTPDLYTTKYRFDASP